MDDKQSIYTCLQGVGIVFGLVFVNDILNERWFDVGLMLVAIMIVLGILNKISKIE